MKKRYFFFLLPVIVFAFSCGDNNNSGNTDSLEQVTASDPFKESVMRLRRNGFLKKWSDKELDSIIDIYRTDQMNGMKYMMIASGDLMFLDVSTEGSTPHDIYKMISDSIGNRYADLKADELKWEYLIESKAKNVKDTEWVVIKQRFGNAWYERKLLYWDNWPIDNFFYRMYNTMLADSSRDTRLYLVDFYCDTCRGADNEDDFIGSFDVDRMGIIRLNKQQADTLLDIPQLMIEPVDEFSIYNTHKTEEELARLERSGIFAAKDMKYFGEFSAEVKSNSIYSQTDIMEFADTIFRKLMLDTLNDYNPFEDALNSINRASRGKFLLKNIVDERIGNTHVHNVRFSLNGVEYQHDLELKNGLTSPYIVDMVNLALDEQKVGGCFYSVASGDETVTVVYIENSITEQAKNSGFFPIFDKGGASELKILFDRPSI